MTPLALSLAGKVAFVTGVGSGIGRASAVVLARAGARVAGFTRKRADALEAAREVSQNGGELLALHGDVARESDLRRAVRTIDRTWGRIDIVVANAGINGVWAPLEKLTEREWERTHDVNLKGTFLTVKTATPLLKRSGGSVVIVASINGTRIFSNSGASAYSASKAGQVAFARMIALELARDRIRVNTICPGAIDTRIEENTKRRGLAKIQQPVIFPKGTIPLTGGASGTSEQVAHLVWFLASDYSAHITGTEVFIDGAQSLLQG